MKQSIIETLVGFLVIIIAILFLSFAYNKNNSARIDNGYLINASFENAEGISSGSDVRLAGIKIGFVEAMELDKNSFLAILHLRINKAIKLPKDSRAAIATFGLLGDKFISITAGESEEDLAENDNIKYTQSTINIESLINKLIYSNKP